MKFDIVLHGEDYQGVLIKSFEGETLPRIGEDVDIFGEDLKVEYIIHNLRKGAIQVWLQADLPTWMLCDAYLSGTGWRFDGYDDEDMEDLMEAVADRKKEKP